MFGNRASEAADKTGDFEDRIDSAIDRLRSANSVLTAEGELLAEGERRLSDLLEKRFELQEQRGNRGGAVRRDGVEVGGRRGLGLRRRLEREITELGELIERREIQVGALRTALSGGAEAGRGAAAIGAAFRELDLDLDAPSRKIRDFYRTIVDGSRQATEAALLEAKTARDSPLVQGFLRLRAENSTPCRSAA